MREKATLSPSKQECNRVGQKPRIPGLLQPAIFDSKTQQPVETYTGPQHPEIFLKTQSFKMETPETIRTSLQAGEWVTSIDFKDHTFTYRFSQCRKYMQGTCTSRVSPTSSKHYHSACPQPQWSLQQWPKTSSFLYCKKV